MSGWAERLATQAADILICNFLDTFQNILVFKQELANV